MAQGQGAKNVAVIDIIVHEQVQLYEEIGTMIQMLRVELDMTAQTTQLWLAGTTLFQRVLTTTYANHHIR